MGVSEMRRTRDMHHQIEELLKSASQYSMDVISKKVAELFDNEQDYLFQILNALDTPIFIKSLTKGFLFVNEAYCQLMKTKAEDVIGKLSHEVFDWPSEENQVHSHADLELLKSKQTQVYESIVTNANQEKLYLTIKKLLIFEENDQTFTILGTLKLMNQERENAVFIDRFIHVKKELEDIKLDIVSAETHQVYQKIIENAIRLIGKRCSATFVKLTDDNFLEVQTCIDYNQNLIGTRFNFKTSMQWLLSKDNLDEIIRIDDFQDLPEIAPQLAPNHNSQYIRSALSIPLTIEKKLTGYINIDSIYPKMFNQDDVQLMKWYKIYVELLLENINVKNASLHTSITDVSTGLFNRFEYERQIFEWLNSTAEFKPWYLMAIDMANLSEINRLGGWDIGDQVLSSYSNLLVSNQPWIKIATRYLGDKLLVVCSDEVLNRMDGLKERSEIHYGKGCITNIGIIHTPVAIVLSESFNSQESYQKAFNSLIEKLIREKASVKLTAPFFIESE